ncbi:MAG: outer membrane protein assembly factor BamA [Candidatus Aminicenantales bacterium]
MLKFIKDSKLLRIPFLLLVVGSCLIVYSVLSADERESYPLIAEIEVKVDGFEEKDVREMISIREGERLSLKKINEVVKFIYKTGAFSDIKVLKKGEDQVKLTFLLTKKLITRRISFLTDRKVPLRKVKSSLYSLQENSPFSERSLERAREEIKEVLRREGYLHPEIKASYEVTRLSSVNVLFEINAGRRYTIEDIDFVGETIFSEKRLRREMRSKEGEVYIPALIEEDVARLVRMYRQKGYERAEVEVESSNFDEEEMGIFLSLRIEPHERFEIEVKGAEVPLDLLGPIWEEDVFEEWALEEGEARIVSYLRKKGYLFSKVNSSIKRTESVIKVMYAVKRGESYRIKDIEFKGLNYFSPSELKKELEVRKKMPFLSWVGGERIFELPREIEALYKTHGFPQTRVDLNFEKKGRSVKAIFSIEEGVQEKIGNIAIEGNDLFDEDELLGRIETRVGGPFFQATVNKDEEKLENFYFNQGFRGTEVTARTEKMLGNLVSVRFSVTEGERVKIEKIIITGNIVTKRRTILREMRIKEGDYASLDKILDTKRRLERLGIFSELRIEEVPLGSQKENLVISVREGQRNYIGLGLGLETMSEPYSFAIWNSVIRPRATAEYIRSNVLGSGSQLSLVGQLSTREKRVVLSWEQPYFFGLPWQTYLNAWIENEVRTSFTYERRGASLTAIRNTAENLVLITTTRWVRTNLLNLQISESKVDRQHSPFSAFSLSGSFIWDRRDDPFNPEKGSFLSLVAEWAYPLFGAQSDYLKNFLKFQHFLPLLSRISMSATFRLGLATGKVPIHERFFAGGSNSFRGETFDMLGPRDPQSDMPRGGKALVLANFELVFPLSSKYRDLFGAFFYDMGNVFPEIRDISISFIQHALGAGIRYRTPLGPVRLDFGVNLSNPERKGKILVFITIGNVF